MALHVIGHPVAHDALLELRDRTTPSSAFRRAATRISLILATEALAAFPSRPSTVTTPLGPAEGRALAADVVVVPVLRAGLGMVEAVLQLVPAARVGHIGLQRDEDTAAAAQYYARLPPGIDRSHVLLVDPMLATGGSASAAIDLLKAAGASRIAMICIVCAPEGIAEVEARHPEVPVYTPAVDHGLNASKFIVPGLGDFGDRLYDT